MPQDRAFLLRNWDWLQVDRPWSSIQLLQTFSDQSNNRWADRWLGWANGTTLKTGAEDESQVNWPDVRLAGGIHLLELVSHPQDRYPFPSTSRSELQSWIFIWFHLKIKEFFTLSKQMMSTPPHRLMCFALRQKIFCAFSRRWAKAVVAVSAAGKIGGMTTVTISSELRITSCTVACVELLSFKVSNWILQF